MSTDRFEELAALQREALAAQPERDAVQRRIADALEVLALSAVGSGDLLWVDPESAAAVKVRDWMARMVQQ